MHQIVVYHFVSKFWFKEVILKRNADNSGCEFGGSLKPRRNKAETFSGKIRERNSLRNLRAIFLNSPDQIKNFTANPLCGTLWSTYVLQALHCEPPNLLQESLPPTPPFSGRLSRGGQLSRRVPPPLQHPVRFDPPPILVARNEALRPGCLSQQNPVLPFHVLLG